MPITSMPWIGNACGRRIRDVDLAIETDNLSKHYLRLGKGRVAAIDGLTLVVPRGGVFGFLGPNGAGKTTTIRCLLGLVGATSGRCRLLGTEVTGRNLHYALRRVGSLVETPTFFPTTSGRKNLSILARLHGIPRHRVDRALEAVSLADRADDDFRTYSLGMKQRLGIAAALLKDPELLILDEPANGLDPAGIREVRALLRRLGDEGRTVFVSSHLLGEVEQSCDAVAILNEGRCVADGPVHDVLARAGTDTLVVRLDDCARAETTLQAAGFLTERCSDHVRVRAPASRAAEVTRVLAGADLWVSELRPEHPSLEDAFFALTAGASHG